MPSPIILISFNHMVADKWMHLIVGCAVCTWFHKNMFYTNPIMTINSNRVIVELTYVSKVQYAYKANRYKLIISYIE